MKRKLKKVLSASIKYMKKNKNTYTSLFYITIIIFSITVSLYILINNLNTTEKHTVKKEVEIKKEVKVDVIAANNWYEDNKLMAWLIVGMGITAVICEILKRNKSMFY